VHLRVVEIGKLLFAPYGLTPARFDMLRIVLVHEEHGVLQSRIRALLGVSGATVSRMLKALEALGFVTRKALAADRRNLLVALTGSGLAIMKHAMARYVDNGGAHRLARRGLGFDPKRAGPKLATLQRFLWSMRKVYADTAPFADPWSTDPLVPYHYTTVVDGRIRYGDRDLLAEAAAS
jgi:DNA-binding MarR family transcriptional regulator